MDIATLVDMTRKLVLRDTKIPQLWGDDEIIFCLNRAYNEIFKLMYKRDETTVAITQIKLLSNLGIYALDSRILTIQSARLKDDQTFGAMDKELETRLDSTISNWRNLTGTPRKYCPGAYSGFLSVYPKFDNSFEAVGVANIQFMTPSTISWTKSFPAFVAGDSINISGSISNDGYYTVVSATATSIVVAETTLVNEVNSSPFIRKVMDTMMMTVNRLAMARFTTQDISDATEITEMRDDHVEGLIDGIAKRAFLKPDTMTFDPGKAEYHRNLFETFKKEVKRDIILLHKSDKSRVPRSGTSIYY